MTKIFCYDVAQIMNQICRFPRKYFSTYRSSHQRCSVRKGVLRNFEKFTGKYLCESLFFNKFAGLVQVFSCEHCEISKDIFLQNTSGQLLLTIKRASDFEFICRSSPQLPEFLRILRVFSICNLSLYIAQKCSCEFGKFFKNLFCKTSTKGYF